jgi:hypothetical protein
LPKLSDRSKDTDPTVLVNEREAMARQAIGSRLDLYREILDAYDSKGYVDDPEGVHIKINRLRAAIKQNVPRHAAALWPQRPYIDFRSKREEYGRRAKNKVKVIDGENERAKFWARGCDWLEKGESFGNAGLEVGWDVWVETVEDRKIEVEPRTGHIVGISSESYDKQMDGLKLKVHGPHACLWSPGGNTALDKEWLIVREVFPNGELERMFDEGVWKLSKGVTMDKLRSVLKAGPAAMGYDQWSGAYQSDLAGFAGAARDGVSVLLRLFSKDRWITVVNYALTVQDTDNRHTNMDKRIKPVAWLTINAHIGDESFYGDGEWALIRDLAEYDDALLSLYIEARMVAGNPVVLYNKNTGPDKSEIVLQPGQSIPVNTPSGRPLTEGIDFLNPPQANTDLLDLHGLFGDLIDRRMGTPGIMRGEAPTPKQTLGGTEIILQEAVTRLGHQTRYVEHTGLYEANVLVVKACAANMGPVQIMDQGGLDYEEMIDVVTPDPQDIPGGFEWELQGAERVVRRQEKDQKALETFNLAANHPAMASGPGSIVLLREVLERSEVLDDKQIEQLRLDDQIALASAALDMQLAQIQQQGMTPVPPEGGPAPTGGFESVGQQGAVAPPAQVGEPAPEANPAERITAI